MYFDKYAPWEHYPKTLRQHEIENPMSVVADFFFADSVKGHGKRLKEWRYYVVNDEHYNEKRHGPGTLLFVYDLNLKLLEAMFLLLCTYKNFSYQQEKLTEAQLEAEKEQWEYYPKNLTLKEQLNPYIAVKKVFKKIKPQAYRDHLHEWSHVALYNNADTEGLYAGEIIAVYENLLKLYSAAWLIYQRESGKPELKRSKSGTAIEGFSTEPIELRTIKPNPTPAEKLALEELKNLILKRCPQVEMIIHLGTHPAPFTFYLLVLTSNEEKTPEHEISNKIEDNCQYLAKVHAIVHKANSAKESLNIGERFWSSVINNGVTLYKSPELVLPEPKEISKELLLERAKFNWERWGIQGKEFLKGSELYKTDHNFRLAAFLLHQSVESVLKGIIQAVIGYRVQMHNLSRLLSLTLLFSDELRNVFEPDTTEGAQIFTLLQNAYSQSRYNSAFNPDEESVRILSEQVKKLNYSAERIYKQFIKNME
ncbi:HEPN domain-containing protein [Mucilaginibacter gotjawali]|uniref:HEPN domain-containing protein n=1 Tax=Mucilaginibacter gotjawali TaxID=1550579 RepID=A0A839SJQ4_9SPHI|nr:HEPN domain-containing protein [Mucilaginibacter gotjawali]MBB3056727.1 HEPN domain-containing protein [Mucilaginibacter gotjawali]